jgi:negative regulator of flagellin synthesis FlgM
MKIDNSFNTPTTTAIPDEQERSARRAVADAASVPPGANVQISPLSAHMQAIEHGFADTPIVNSARVAELKQAISNGHFKVDAEKVADRLLATVRDLILAHKA